VLLLGMCLVRRPLQGRRLLLLLLRRMASRRLLLWVHRCL